jgi:glycosyltransferase involved in cell wall biosynthesis
MQNIKVSVIMNCFNGERYLVEAIDSVRNQTLKDWELIFWDNQSIDNSKDIFLQYEDDRLKYFYADQHTTLGEARNLAIEKSRGDWINFIDVDDKWHKDKLEKQLLLINSGDDIGFVYGRTETIYSGSEKVKEFSQGLLPENDIFEQLLKDNFVYYLSALINKDKLLKIPKIPEHFNQVEDYYIFLHLSKLYQVKALQEVCCSYRLHDNNLSRNEPIEGAKESLELVTSFLPDERAKKAIGYKLSSLAVAQIRKRKYYNAILSLMSGGFIQFSKRLISRMIK